MTDLVRHSAPLPDKIRYAQALAESNLLPPHYQRQPANLLLALEYAEALGIPPINAITGIVVIKGKPSASADLIAAMVRKAGHKLRLSGDDKHATAQIIRADDPDYTYEATWDEQKARTAGLWGSGNWKTYPAAMLRARAITEVARMGASDALYGVVYTPEELGAKVDEDGAPVASERVEDVVEAEVVTEPARDWLAEGYACPDLDTLRKLWIEARDAGANTPGSDLRTALDGLVEAHKADQQPADVTDAVVVEDAAADDGWPAPAPVPS